MKRVRQADLSEWIAVRQEYERYGRTDHAEYRKICEYIENEEKEKIKSGSLDKGTV